MERTPISQEVADHQKAKKAQIYSSFKKATEDSFARPIAKSEFETQYPADKFEIYSLAAVDKFRQDILKADDVADKDEAFKKATVDLKPFIVHGDGKKVIVFTREKQKGE